jgi:hypothetical protein
MDEYTIKHLFLFFLIGATLVSIYLFIDVLVLKRKQYLSLCNTWQFPMLLALTLEVVYNA